MKRQKRTGMGTGKKEKNQKGADGTKERKKGQKKKVQCEEDRTYVMTTTNSKPHCKWFILATMLV